MSYVNTMLSKETLRKTMLKVRSGLDVEDASTKIAAHFCQTEAFGRSQHIAAYFSVKGEIDPSQIMTIAWQHNKNIYVPSLSTETRLLTFPQYQVGDPLEKNRYGIDELANSKRKAILPEELDIVLLPIVAFDNKGNRVGMGAGFYDYTFQDRPGPLLIGIAHEFQKVDSIPADPWDIPLHGVVTEKDFYWF